MPPAPSFAAVLSELTDPMDDATYFFPGASLTITDNGDSTLSFTHNIANIDEVAHWGINGADQYLAYTENSRLLIVPVAAIDNGQWGFSIQWFDASSTYLGQDVLQSQTASTAPQLYNLGAFSAPAGTDSWRIQLRIFDQDGLQGPGSYGFTFTQFNGSNSAAPEPSSFILGLLGLFIFSSRKRFQRISRAS